MVVERPGHNTGEHSLWCQLCCKCVPLKCPVAHLAHLDTREDIIVPGPTGHCAIVMGGN